MKCSMQCLYVHVHANDILFLCTCRYVHVHLPVCIQIHVHTYGYMYSAYVVCACNCICITTCSCAYAIALLSVYQMFHDLLQTQVVEVRVREMTLLLEERLLFKLLQWAGLGGVANKEGSSSEDEIMNMLTQR